MSPRPYQPHWRHHEHIAPQHHDHAKQHQYYHQPQFVAPYSSPPQHYYYDSPCNLHYHQFNMANDAAEASRPSKKSKVEPKVAEPKAPVPGNGLRHFSMKICERVKSMGSTSYSEVADELIKELREDEAKAYQATAESTPAAAASGKTKRNKPPQSKYDEKNIRRRVYDALNVLMAMDIIVKDKKLILWNGLPGERTLKPAASSNEPAAVSHPKKLEPKQIQMPSEQLLKLKKERSKRQAEIQRKREILQELIAQTVCFNNLYQRNHAREVVDMTSKQAASSSFSEEKIPLPFIVVSTAPSSVIQCEMCPAKTNVNFDFSTPFEINDDNEILKRIGMDVTTEEELFRMLPGDLRGYCERWGLVDGVLRRGYARA